MTSTLLRNFSIAVLALFFLAACGGDNGTLRESDLEDMGYGSADAPAVLIEYASTTCPACAAYHSLMGDTIKELTDAGKLRFVFREFPRDTVDIAGFATARCAGPDKYFDVLDDLFTNQQGINLSARNGTVRGSLQAIAARHGIEATQFETCLSDQGILAAISNAQDYGSSQGVTDTPTLFFNGAKLTGTDGRTPESLKALIEISQ